MHLIRFRCPSCGRRIKVPGHSVGCHGRCPTCGVGFIVPNGDDSLVPEWATSFQAEIETDPTHGQSQQALAASVSAETGSDAADDSVLNELAGAVAMQASREGGSEPSEILRLCCGQCRKIIDLPARLAGQKRFCPRCGWAFTIPVT